MIVQRVERHIVRQSNEHFKLLDDFCFKSKNLYNHANFLVRKEFVENGKWLRYQDLNGILKDDAEFPDYREMPTAQSAQQILRLIDKNWTSLFKSIKEWKRDKSKFLGKPKLPKYKKKNGRMMLILTNQNVKLKDGVLIFPKVFKGFSVKTKVMELPNLISFQQVRILPKSTHIVVEVVYKVEVADMKPDNGRYLSIDLGIDNLAAVTNNFGESPILVNGKGLKSVNQYYNKVMGKLQSISILFNKSYRTRQMGRVTTWRNLKIEDYMHKASRMILDFAIKNNASKIVIGYNQGWKQESNLSKKVNQKFVGLPFLMLIEKIQYKAEDAGIEVILTEESYTSGTSFLDGELPTKENYHKKRRVKRGLFKSNDGKLINADVNGSLQILKKVFPNAYKNGLWDSGCVTQLVKVSFAA